jgi:CheY-like chemotaxis protein
VQTGALVQECALELRPDLIVVADLADMTAIEICRRLHNDLRIVHAIPILMVVDETPTPELLVAGLSAGAWDYVRYPADNPHELSIKLHAYAQAKRNVDLALADGLVDPGTGLHSRMGLARRARELGTLMARTHGALSCLVFSLDPQPVGPKLSRLAAHATRASDVVGALSAHAFAVLAPGTDQAGAVQLARRIWSALLAWFGADAPAVTAVIRAGYEAVGNLKYAPIDPVDLLAHANAAVRDGTPEPGMPWLRRYAAPAEMEREREPRFSPAGGVTA